LTVDENGPDLPIDNSSTQHYNWDDIPEFKGHCLPPGEWPTTWDRFVDRFGKNPTRQRRIEGLQQAIHVLRDAGCPTVYIDGSFVTKKAAPSDIDCCWQRDTATQRRLKQLNSVLLDGSPGGRYRQKMLYGCEVFPHDAIEWQSRLPFLNYFQKDKHGKPKGIIVLKTKDVP
jgi:hypothetical protein